MSRQIKTFYSVCGPTECDVNTIAEYELNATGEDNLPKDVDISHLKGWLRSATGDVEATIRRDGLGLYKVVARPHQAGYYYLDVQVQGRGIFTTTDMTTEVKKDSQLDRPRLTFELEGQGIHAGRAGERTSFTIRVTTGTKAPVDIDHTRLRVTCGSTVATIQRQGMGEYEAMFLIRNGGDYVINVVYDGNDVISQQVRFADRTGGNHSALTTVPPARTRPNTAVRFALQSKDSSGRLVSIGGDQWQATSLGPAEVRHLRITDNQNGTYSGEIIFPEAGSYTIDVCLEGEHAQGSPFKVVVEH